MKQSLLLSLSLIAMLAVVGCTRTGTAPTPTPPPSATFTPMPTIPPATATPIPTTAPVESASTDPAPATTSDAGDASAAQLDVTPPDDCDIPTGWEPYEIQSGDTLFSLGLQTETTIAELATANCLENPDVLDLGQIIYLPSSTGAASAPEPTQPAVGGEGPPPSSADIVVSVSPFREQSGNFVLAPGPVTLMANNLNDPNIARVTFFVTPRGTGTNPAPIATVEPIDGSTASTEYIVQPNLLGDLFAVAYDATGQELGRSPSIPVVADVG